MIINRTQVLPDELYFSYLVRLAKVNCLPYDLARERITGSRCRSFDIREGFDRFCDCMGLDEEFDRAMIYLALSTFAFEGLFMTVGRQTRYICGVSDMPGFYSKKGLFDKLRFCSACCEDDIRRFGRIYAHRAHQLTGVKTCYIHGIPLIECGYLDRDNIRLDYIMSGGQMIEVDTGLFCLETAYSVFAKSLLDASLNADIRLLRDIAFDRLRNKGYGDFLNSSFKLDFEDTGFEQFMDKDIISFRRSMADVDLIAPKNMVALLMFLYVNSEEMVRDLREKSRSSKNYPGFKLLSEHNGIIKSYYHEDCGKSFMMTDMGMDIGIGCVHCAGKEQLGDFYKRLILQMGNQRYIPVGNFKSHGRSMALLHKDCGKTCEISPAGFVFNGARCPCEKQLSYEDVDKKVQLKGDFRLLRFSGVRNKALIMHDGCGKSFEVYLYNFYDSPYCRACFENMDTKMFCKRIKDVLGPEYVVMSEYKGKDSPVYVRHVPCGHIMGYKAKSYLHGYGCRVCRAKAKQDKLDQEIAETDSNRLYFELKNRYGNDVIFSSEVAFEGWNNNKTKNALTVLFKAGKLVHIGFGAFVLDICSQQYTVEDLIYAKYVKRHGKVIGYFSGVSFGYTDKPVNSIWHIATIIEAGPFWRNIEYEGRRLCVRRPRSEKDLDARNVLFLPVLDRLAQNKRLNDDEKVLVKRYFLEHSITKGEIKPHLKYYPHYVKDRLEELF